MTAQLMQYLPAFYQEVKEVKEIMATVEQEIEQLSEIVDEAQKSFFINKTNENTISFWEKEFLLDLSDKSIEERKREVLSLMLGFSKLTCKKIEQITLTKTTYGVSCFIENSNIVISFSDIGYPNEVGMADVLQYIEQLKPAHLGVEIILQFRIHKNMKQYPHRQLSAYTQSEIKNKRGVL